MIELWKNLENPSFEKYVFFHKFFDESHVNVNVKNENIKNVNVAFSSDCLSQNKRMCNLNL